MCSEEDDGKGNGRRWVRYVNVGRRMVAKATVSFGESVCVCWEKDDGKGNG